MNEQYIKKIYGCGSCYKTFRYELTEQGEKYMRENYMTAKNADIADLFGVSVAMVSNLAKKIGLRKNKLKDRKEEL